jgi:hypothetical protein
MLRAVDVPGQLLQVIVIEAGADRHGAAGDRW